MPYASTGHNIIHCLHCKTGISIFLMVASAMTQLLRHAALALSAIDFLTVACAMM